MMPEKEYILFCDESDKKGPYYSNFYGGVLVGASQYMQVTDRLNHRKQELNLFGEIKWAKVTERYLPKYEEMVRRFFREIADGNVKVRIMFTQNAQEAQGLTEEQLDQEYFILYYQFVKHAFGLKYMSPKLSNTRLRLYFDQFPDTREKGETFKSYLHMLQHSAEFRKVGIVIAREDIAEVRSHDHVLVQCLDIVLGAITFRLNDKHRRKSAGKRTRAKKTIAKQKLYKLILQQIRAIHPNFNIGVSTGKAGGMESLWTAKHAHWCFRPASSVYRPEYTKRGTKEENPT